MPDVVMTTVTPMWSAVNATLEEILTTEKPSEDIPVLKKAHDGLVIIILVTVMYGMGCHITWKEVWEHLRRPIGVVIGMVSQFIFLPLSSFCLIKIFNVPTLFATGMLVLSCCPGGVTSNLFSYILDGSVPLSITMTACSTLVALGMMPFNIWLYGHSIQTGNLSIPYGDIAQSLAIITAPVVVGMATRWKLPKIAPYMTKLGSYAGMGVIVVVQTMEVFIFPDLLTQVTWQLYLAVCILPALGSTLGYLAGRLGRQTPSCSRTIAIESGIQNVGTALAVISRSFPFEHQQEVIVFPWLYAFASLGMFGLLSAIYRLLKKYVWKEEDETDPSKENEDTNDGAKETVKPTIGDPLYYENLGFIGEGKYHQNSPV